MNRRKNLKKRGIQQRASDVPATSGAGCGKRPTEGGLWEVEGAVIHGVRGNDIGEGGKRPGEAMG